MNKAERADIASLAEAIFDQYQAAGRLDPIRVMDEYEITHNFGNYRDSFDGLLEHASGRFHVFCNLDRVEKRDSPRARFTLAHELGHYFIDEHRNALASGAAPSHPSFAEFESNQIVEQEADYFASCLLMPEHRFRREVKNAKTGLPTIIRVAAGFGTSITSAAIRFVSLEISPCTIIKWESSKTAWKWVSESLWQFGLRKTIHCDMKIVSGSATEKVFSGVKAHDGYYKSISTASCWFPFIRPGSPKDIILHEHAISLGRFGVMTFLFPDDVL